MKLLNKIWALLLSLLLAVAPVLPLALLTGCNAMDLATPDEAQELQGLDSQLKESASRMDALEAQFQEQMEALEALAEQAKEASTAEDVEALKAAVDERVAEAVALADAWQLEADAFAAVSAERDDLVAGIAQRQSDTVGGVVGSVSPLAAGAVAVLGPLVARLAFPRSREHLVEGAKNLMKAQLGDFVRSLGKAYGAQHTTYDPDELLHATEAVAREKGDDEMVMQIKALKASKADAA